MSVIGIIAEYNPFHNGHMHQIKKALEKFPNKPIVCVMSGNFVQRGEPAIFDKHVRTRAALMGGADMVIELPVMFATASAEYFSHYAVSILSALGVVDYLCFGSEEGSSTILDKIADVLVAEDYGFRAELRARLAEGKSYPAAREAAVLNILPEAVGVIDKPNNILGIEYIKALKRLNSAIIPFAIKREGEGYHSGDYTKELSSAKAVRAALRMGIEEPPGVPDIVKSVYADAVNRRDFHDIDNLSDILSYIVKTKPPQYLAEIMDVDEGMHNAIVDVFGRERLLSEAAKRLKSKRYAHTRIMRALLHILLAVRKDEFTEFYERGPRYIRVLGFRKNSEYLFSEITSSATLPLLTNLKNYREILCPLGIKLIEKEIMATDIYNLTGTKAMPKNAEFREPIVIL